MFSPCSDNNPLSTYNTSYSDIHTMITCLMICVIHEICRCTHVLNSPLNTNNISCHLDWSIKEHCHELQSTPGVHFVMLIWSSCEVVKMFQPTASDGEYILHFKDGVAQVYCHGMNSSHPVVSSSCKITVRRAL